MSDKNEVNPFAGFNLLDGGFSNVTPPDDESSDDDVVGGDPTVINDDELDPELGQNAKVAEEALKKIADKQAKASKDKVEVEEESTEDEDEETLDEEGAGFKPALIHLSEKGILDFDEANIEDSEEGFEKAVDQTITNRFEKLLHNKLGDDGLALLSFVENGGNPKSFIEAYYNNNSWSDYDISDNEAAQKIALRESLRLAGDDPEEIEDMITEYTDNGTLEKRAKAALGKLQKFEEAQKKDLIELQKNKAEQDRIAEKKYWDDFKSDLLKKEDIKGFKITPKVKENLINYMTVVDKKTGKTAYQKAVESETDAAYLFAYLSMNNFDISKLEKQVASKAASKLNGLMKNYQPSSKERISSGRTEVNESGDNPFAGFKKLQ